MRVVLDTNVLVSGLISAGGPCAQILRLLVADVLQPCLDERMLAEYETVLSRPKLRFDAQDVAGVLELLRSRGELVTPMPLPVRLPDPMDLPFLEVAVAAEAVLVTGNARHFPVRLRSGAAVVGPRQLLDALGGAR